MYTSEMACMIEWASAQANEATASSVNWLGDVIMPIGVLVISSVFTFWLARVTMKRARTDLAFQRDQRYADEFLLATEHVMAYWIVNEPPAASKVIVGNVNTAFNRFCRFASGADMALGPYLSDRWMVLDTLQQKVEAGGVPADEERIAADEALDQMKEIIRDWAFPEKRRDCWRTVLKWQYSMAESNKNSEGLQIDRWLLHEDPADGWLRRKLDLLSVTVRLLREDAASGELKAGWWARIRFLVHMQEYKLDRFRAASSRREEMPPDGDS